jgi:sec-independent protein translocase protein TatA
MLGNLTGWHLLIILAVILLLFGAPKLPALAKSIGQSMRIFRGEMKTMKDENGADVATSDAADTSTPASKTTAAATSKPAARSTAAKSKP